MNRIEKCNQKFQELFDGQPITNEGNDPEFMRILQRFIFGEVCYVGSLDNRMRELITVTVLTTISALPQLKVHVSAALKVKATPIEIREAIYQCAPFIGFPRTLNAISTMNEVFTENNIALPLESQETREDDNRYLAGLEIQKPTYGDEIKDRYTWLPGEFKEAIPNFLTAFGFGDFNTRTGLNEKDRELLTVVLLAAMGGAEIQVKSHVIGALKTGSTKEEVVCALVHAMPYMGIPRLFNALNCSKDVLSD